MKKPANLSCSKVCGGTAEPIKGTYYITCTNAKVAWVGSSVDIYHRYSENAVKLGLGSHGCRQLQEAHNAKDTLEFLYDTSRSVAEVKRELSENGFAVFSRGCANDTKTVRKRNRRIYAKHLKTGEIKYWDNVIMAVLDGYTNVSWAVKGQYNPSSKNPQGSNIYNGYEWGYCDD